MSAGQHTLVRQAVKAAFRLRPPLPKYSATFNIQPVLIFLRQILGNNNYLSIKLLSYKCLFLISFSSLARIDTLAKLGSQVTEHANHIVIPLLAIEKQARGQ